MWKIQVQSLGQEDPLEKEMATHSSILAWRIPWTEEPSGLQSMGSQRVRCDWVTTTHTIYKSVLPWYVIGISSPPQFSSVEEGFSWPEGGVNILIAESECPGGSGCVGSECELSLGSPHTLPLHVLFHSLSALPFLSLLAGWFLIIF